MRTSQFMLSLAALGSSLVLAASLTLPASAGARPGSGGRSPARAIAVTGTVRTSGKADPNVKVYLHAWPDQAVVQALKIGQKVPWLYLGSTTTNASGQYSISLPLAKLAPEATSGVVNLYAGTGTTGQYFSLVTVKNAGNAYLATGNAVVNLQAPSKNKHPCSGPDDSLRYVKSLGQHWATVGQTYVPTSDASQRFSYYNGQFSSIGAGTSNSVQSGAFSADGSYSWSKSGSKKTGGSWPRYGAHRSVLYRTRFHFALYRCYVYGVAIKSWTQHVNGYDGGARIKKPSVPRATYCESYIKGYKFSSNDTRAETWRHRWGIHAGLGFDASVVTGYDGDAVVHYHLYKTRKICGTNADPGADPRLIVVRS